MLSEYLDSALRRTEYKRLDDQTWFAEIPGFEGVWANAESLEDCRGELREVLEEWLVLKLKDRDSLPSVDGIVLEFDQPKAA